ncbi:MAG: cyclodeaminase/cyclohydrolase family protein [Phycisphaerales bacterium]|nr:cyclodeaminase/cyclohydrolase family protein [Phycisphaerales bacterium]
MSQIGRFAECTVARFLDDLGSDAPCPGGGAAAALAGALAASLGKMVCALTVGKPRYADVEAEVRELHSRFERADRLLRGLMDEDASAYGELSAAFKLEKSNPDRPVRVSSAAEIACMVPIETASFCRSTLVDLARLARIGNQNLAADIESAIALAKAGKAAALANARANLPLIRSDRGPSLACQVSALASDE